MDKPTGTLVRHVLAVAMIVALSSSCTAAATVTGSQGTSPSPTASRSAEPVDSPSARPSPPPSAPPVTPSPTSPAPSIARSSPTPPAPSTTPPSCAALTLARLTEAQRIGQLFLVGMPYDRLDTTLRSAIATAHLGSVWYASRSSAGVAALRSVSDAVQAQATLAATGGVGFFVAANQEGGLIQALSGPGFDTIPSAVSQGTLAPGVLEAAAAIWGRQLRAAGIDLDFAPVADVVPAGTEAQNAPIGQLERAYGSDPATVSSHVAAFVAGMAKAGVATTAKHFPGLGRVAGNTDFTGGVVDDVTTIDDPYLGPFRRAITAGVPFVMVSLATYERIDPAHVAAFSPTVIGGMLRRELGFSGVVMSDSLAATAVAAIPAGTRALDFLQAGGDMLVVDGAETAVEMAAAIAARAAVAPPFRARVDEAVLRVLRAKQAAGLLPCG